MRISTYEKSLLKTVVAKDEAAVKFLETGTNAMGKTALPPMPQFRLNHEDAVAVVAYLRSLKR